MRYSLWHCAIVGIAFLFSVNTASAQAIALHWQRCKQYSPALGIEGCTALIEGATRSSLEVAEAYRYRGLAYLRAGEYDRAISDQNQSMRLNTQKLAPVLFRGLALYAKGNDRAALRDFNAVIAVDTRFAEAIYARGLVLRRLGNSEAARKDFALASNINGDVSKNIADFGIRP
jgi:tetratricopeptide (TPR) repeat protein